VAHAPDLNRNSVFHRSADLGLRGIDDRIASQLSITSRVVERRIATSCR
jgi:hypothetical protein